MAKLHEILAVEKTKTDASKALMADTGHKFAKFEYFQGHMKSLAMIEDSPQNKAVEQAAAEVRNLPTTVQETLEYALKYWADSEDITFQKNKTNQHAIATLNFRGEVVAEDIPVDELLGLESRLQTLRAVMAGMPTLNAGVEWKPDTQSGRKGAWIASLPEKTIKTEKTTTAVVLYPATDKHPAQVKEVPADKTVGTFTQIKTCGAATSAQKAEVISVIDDLMAEVKQARMRANSVEAVTDKIGAKITGLILKAFA